MKQIESPLQRKLLGITCIHRLNHEGTKTQWNTKFMHESLSTREEYLARQLVDIAICVHKHLGPGLLESVYLKCFSYELMKRNISFDKQRNVPIIYENLEIDDGLRLDLIVEDLIIIELKAQENYHYVWEAQLLSYLKLTGKRLGFLFNFHVPLMKDGVKRIIL